MQTAQELQNSAYEASLAGRKQESLLLYCQAATKAKEEKINQLWLDSMHRAGAAALDLSKIPMAMRLFLEALAEEHRMPREITWVFIHDRLMELKIRRRSTPLPELVQALQRFRNILSEYPQWQCLGDLQEADILAQRGLFSQAVSLLENVWQRSDLDQVSKLHTSRALMQCSLNLRRFDLLQAWLQKFREVETDYKNGQRLEKCEHEIHLQLAQTQDVNRLKAIERTAQDHIGNQNFSVLEDTFRHLSVRISLLDSVHGDPTDLAHPAKKALRMRTASKWYKGIHFERRLLSLDYRIAALRYALGVAPVDDLYYTTPQILSGVAPTAHEPNDVQTRLNNAHVAANWARAYAKKLDERFECDWRQKIVDERLQRTEELAHHANSRKPT